jgi:DNA topoisomerase VI subunit B
MRFFDWDKESISDEEYVYDETAQRAFDASERLLEKYKAERDQRQKAEAIERGFSCWEELCSYEYELLGRNEHGYDQQVEKECALLGKTVEEYYDEHPQRDKHVPLFAPSPQCDCDGK